MAYGDPYLSVQEFKARVASVGTANDGALLTVLTAASRQIDTKTGRRFDKTDTAVARDFAARDARFVDIDDLVSLTSLVTDNGSRTYPTTWVSTDYDLVQIGGVDAFRPYGSIRTAPTGLQLFYTGVLHAVRVTGVWGWSQVPDPIKEATFLVANRLKSLWNAPFGITGASNQQGGMRVDAGDVDAFVCDLISPYMVMPV